MRHSVYFSIQAISKTRTGKKKTVFLYDGMRRQAAVCMVVETISDRFIIRRKWRSRSKKTRKVCYGVVRVARARKEQLEIQKPQWGALSRIHVSSDADLFDSGETDTSQRNDFIEVPFFYEYYSVRCRCAMHAGKIWKSLFLNFSGSVISYTVTRSL